MKLRSIAKWAAIFPALAMGLSGTAFAHKLINIGGSSWVIVCDNNGGNFTFSGSAGGAGDVAGIICPTAMVGGGTSGGNTVEQSVPAQQALKAKGGTVTQCPKGTHWYEPAKACVANGGHPSE
ncbi:hypothetical protein [Novosphingobium sp.]|uniref:hypothetical protein n=1 Tax=Novosphingobium sp. TaxID=1874826 RepID=UPI00286A2801|nr:hypothetical protein [Novosphingobium sp.]